ncbi:hypothetical protein [Streptomyces sp. NPDC053048]|uniref:hypothetical protein n=1 Tax=Streptomyces sp. NPDC053048 TaxID=3365694 RepID=UPI0037CDF3EC
MTTDEQHERGKSGAEGGSGGSGGISIGRMTGGAAASGPGATAEDRSERTGAPAPQEGTHHPVPPVPAPGPGGIVIGEMSGGAAATGRDARAVDASRRLLTVPPELLTAVGELRQDLPRFARTERLAELDDELTGLEEDARREGRTRGARLSRVRELLTDGATAIGALASAAAVAQAISQLLT